MNKTITICFTNNKGGSGKSTTCSNIGAATVSYTHLDVYKRQELEIVPAGKARDCGLDRSMVAGYGQDDRVCEIGRAHV